MARTSPLPSMVMRTLTAVLKWASIKSCLIGARHFSEIVLVCLFFVVFYCSVNHLVSTCFSLLCLSSWVLSLASLSLVFLHHYNLLSSSIYLTHFIDLQFKITFLLLKMLEGQVLCHSTLSHSLGHPHPILEWPVPVPATLYFLSSFLLMYLGDNKYQHK